MPLTRSAAARLAWVAIAALSLGLYIVRIPHRYAGMESPTPLLYLFEGALVLIWMAVGAVILWRTGSSRPGWHFFVAVMLAAYGSTYMQDARTQWALPTFWALVSGALHQMGGLFMFAFCFFFPDGRAVPRRLAAVLIPAWALLAAPAFYAPASAFSLYTWPPAIASLVVVVLLGVNIGVQLYRYRISPDPALRQQTRLVLFGIVMGAVGNMVGQAGHLMLWEQPGLVLGVDLFNHLAHLCIPLSIGFSVLRYHLWEIDRLFNRLTSGDRDNPYSVVALLGNRLEAHLGPEEVLPVIAQTVAESMKVPYVAVALREGDGFEVAAVAGAAEPGMVSVSLPLFYQGKEVGRLIVGQRHRAEPFPAADMLMLKGLARQASPSVYAIELTQALRRSREQLVTAREEERRRLRNDLHDGVGPSLVAHTLKLAAARDLIDRDPESARAILTGLDGDIRTSLGEIRRVVYNLRPPLLDHLGLAGAIRRSVAEYQQAGVAVHLEVSEPLPALPAAVEVAAFRIAQEALNNVVRHARAKHCQVSVLVRSGVPGTRVGRRLILSIVDDGVGVNPQRLAGVGLSSMRERAAEVGGACTIEPAASGGTRVSAWLPIGE